MKKIICLLLAICIILTLTVLASCGPDAYEKASKNADNYVIAAAYDPESHILSASQRVEMTNRSENSFTAVKFHIYANQYREGAENGVVTNVYRAKAYPNGISYGDITFDSVKVEGQAVAYSIEGQDMDILSVPVANELFPDQTTTIEMTYQVQLANVAHRLGYTDNGINLGNFYPVLCRIENGNYVCSPYYNIGDPFVSEVANYNVSLTLPEEYIVASSGQLQDATQTDGFTTYSYEAKAVRDFAMVASDKFNKLSQTADGTQINYYYYNDTEAEESLALAVGMFEYLNKNVGKYPYAQYSVCETEFCFGGMEYPNLSMVTSGSSAYAEAIVHETAHQWFYGIVGNDQINSAWMDEGLADFVTYLYLDECGKTPLSTAMKACTKNYVSYVDVLNRFYENIDTSFRPIDKYKNDNEYVIFTYVKGSILFGTLYETMGKTKFMKALSDYFDEAQFTVAQPQLMIDKFANVGGAEIGSVFESFIEGKEIIGEIVQ
ncbi:MAG: M1 family metallopeptidase [Firmicutes bacterium]|nr:M1 family metallopeptidase [Bacillota bacterium]